uniref:BMP and activin membrane-bound inhibitor n=2 Tax=Lygus hesperus TaxID=30085 RepID=A0A0K8SAD9_LYGHE
MIFPILLFFGVASGMTVTFSERDSTLQPTPDEAPEVATGSSDIEDEITGIELNDEKWAPSSPETAGAAAEIRCYCNLPTCVATSYMCKSKIPGCFSDLQDSMSFDEAIHGCLDFLPRDKEIMCQNKPGGEGLGVKHSLLLCCREDLCNHVDSVNRMTYNESMRRLRDEDIPNFQRQTPSYSSQEVWFKAATIAVPICGFLILLMLIVLAMKILRTDPQALPPKLWAKESTAGLLGGGLVVGHNPGADTSCCGSKKMPLLFQQNDCTRAASDATNRSQFQEKNEANAKLNNPTDLIDLHKASLRAPCNLYQPLIPPSHLPAIHSNIYTNSTGWPLKNS